MKICHYCKKEVGSFAALMIGGHLECYQKYRPLLAIMTAHENQRLKSGIKPKYGVCWLCNQKTTPLGTTHLECFEKYHRSAEHIRQEIQQCLATGKEIETLPSRIERLVNTGSILERDACEVIEATFIEVVETSLKEDIFSKESEAIIDKLGDTLQTGGEYLTQENVSLRVIMARTMREVLEERIPQFPFSMEGTLPFNFQKSEQLVFVFQDVSYVREKTHHQRIGMSAGVSVRVARGLYLRSGSSQGYTTTVRTMEVQDKGMFAITTKHIYFCGSRISHRIPFSKIVTFHPFNDGLGITKDASNATMEVYLSEHGLFAYNLCVNLARMSAA